MKRVFDVNLWGLLEVTKAFLPLLKESRGRRIVNIASCYGEFPVKASKYAVQCYSGLLRQELKQFGVSVHIIDPGICTERI
ncbi:Retinol dehydrogenase 7 [Exaiptasia diaphana]|nr:Retinol dehydrogenase 7 [Exaiptasia diaphana]